MEEHFPEQHWRRVGRSYGAFIFISSIGLGGLALAYVIPNIAIKGLLGGLSILNIVVTLPTVWSHRNDEIVLTADGIKGPGWRRPLRFADVEKIALRKIQLRYDRPVFYEMTFKFKTVQKAMTKWSFRSSCQSTCLHVGTGMSEKPDVMLQTIYRYARKGSHGKLRENE